MLKLYFSPSSSSLATHIALIECGAPHELVPRLISKQATRTPEHLALNPDGKVPVLVTESGRVLTEVAATLYYIARKYPASRLWPVGNLEDEAEVISWMSFAASTMHGSRARGSEHVANAFAVANRKLGDRQWAVGRYSIADTSVPRELAIPSGHRRGAGHLSSARGAPRPDARETCRSESARHRKELWVAGFGPIPGDDQAVLSKASRRSRL